MPWAGPAAAVLGPVIAGIFANNSGGGQPQTVGAQAPSDVQGLRNNLVNWLQTSMRPPTSQGQVFSQNAPYTQTGAAAGGQQMQGPMGWLGGQSGGNQGTNPTPWLPQSPPASGPSPTMPPPAGGGGATSNPWMAPQTNGPAGGGSPWLTNPFTGVGQTPTMTPQQGVTTSPGNMLGPTQGGQQPLNAGGGVGGFGSNPANWTPNPAPTGGGVPPGMAWQPPPVIPGQGQAVNGQYQSGPVAPGHTGGQYTGPTLPGNTPTGVYATQGALLNADGSYATSGQPTGYAPGQPYWTAGQPGAPTPTGIGAPATPGAQMGLNPNITGAPPAASSGFSPNPSILNQGGMTSQMVGQPTPPPGMVGTTANNFIPGQGPAMPPLPAGGFTYNPSQPTSGTNYPQTQADWDIWAQQTFGPGGTNPTQGFPTPPGGWGPPGNSSSGSPVGPGMQGPGNPNASGPGGPGMPTTPGPVGDGSNFNNMYYTPSTAAGSTLNPFASAAGGPGTQSVDQLGGANSPFFQNMMAQLSPAFNQRRDMGLAAAKESAGNLTGSGFGNILGSSINRSLGEEQGALANYATMGLQQEMQRQMGMSQLGQQNNQFNAGGQNQYGMNQANLYQQANLANAGFANQAAGQNANSFLQSLMGMATGGVGQPDVGQQTSGWGAAGNWFAQILPWIMQMGGGSGGTAPGGTSGPYAGGY